jgi:hypothetical protein
VEFRGFRSVVRLSATLPFAFPLLFFFDRP